MEADLLGLERSAPQGRWIQLEMLRDSFLARSAIFEEYRVVVAMDEHNQLVGSLACARAPMELNGLRRDIGLGYDLKVAPAVRGQGISKKMVREQIEHYFIPQGITDYCTTQKADNRRAQQAARSAGEHWFAYPFVYLTIPTSRRLGRAKWLEGRQRFRVGLFSNSENLRSYFQEHDGGLCIWNTYLLYQIRIRRLHPLVRAGQWLANRWLAASQSLPGTGAVLSFAMLYNFDARNLSQFDAVQASLQARGITYLSVCCSPEEVFYPALKRLAINAYPYLFRSTFSTVPEDEIKLDVRCL